MLVKAACPRPPITGRPGAGARGSHRAPRDRRPGGGGRQRLDRAGGLPAGRVQGDLVRLIYVHPAAATTCYVGFGLCALASLAYLWPRTRSRRWDRLAGSSAEVGVVFCVITLVTGSIWGRGSWGVWWTWDARLTLTALLLAVFVGYLALRRTGGDPDARARRSRGGGGALRPGRSRRPRGHHLVADPAPGRTPCCGPTR